MGRATIVSGGPTGRYTIALDYGTAERDARVASLTPRSRRWKIARFGNKGR